MEFAYFPGHDLSRLEKLNKLSARSACQKILDGLQPDIYALVNRKVLGNTGDDNNGGVICAEVLKFGVLPEQVTRWLAASGNWEIETLSDLLLGMGYEPALSLTNLTETQTKSAMEEAARTSAPVVIKGPSATLAIKSDSPVTAADAALPSQKLDIENKQGALAAAQTVMPTFHSEQIAKLGSSLARGH